MQAVNDELDVPLDTVLARFFSMLEAEVDEVANCIDAGLIEAPHQLSALVKAMRNAAANAACIEFDKSLHQAAMDAVKNADKMDLFLPPVQPFDDVILYDNRGAVLFYDAVDYEVGDKETKVALHMDGGKEMATVPLLRHVNIAAYVCAGPGVELLGYGRIGLTAAVSQQRARGLGWNVLQMRGVHRESGRSERRVSHGESGDRVTEAFISDVISAAQCALDQMYYIDLPRHHLVVETPERVRDPAKSKKIPRAHERPRVRVITPEEVRTVYPSLGGSSHVVPHARRGFTKYLTSEKWKAKRWQRIRVRPTWVGPEEWKVGGLRYRVVIRKNDVRSLSTETP